MNAVACGLIDTDMNSHLSRQEQAQLVEEIPADRIGKPEDVARLVGMMCDEGGGYLVGQVITLDGGWT